MIYEKLNLSPASVQEVRNEILVHDKEHVVVLNTMLDKLPADCEWFRFTADESLLQRCRHIYHESWKTFSSGSGKPTATARHIAEQERLIPPELPDHVTHIKKLAAEFTAEKCGPIILGTNDIDNGLFVLIDGNHRASALCLRQYLQADRESVALEFFVACSSQPIWTWE